MPMLDEKLEVLHQVGSVLAEKYGGRFHNFIHSCSPLLYDNGNGLVERLAAEFPRFNDVSTYDGHEIKFYKLAQLGLWFAWATYPKDGPVRLNDVAKMTSFPDYIVPVALRLLGINSYSPALEHAIDTFELIPRNSTQEVEIRAHSIYATALLREEINKIRPAEFAGDYSASERAALDALPHHVLAASSDQDDYVLRVHRIVKRRPRRGTKI